jgi:predicted nucleotidyltransferase
MLGHWGRFPEAKRNEDLVDGEFCFHDMRSHRTELGLEIHKWLLHAEDWSELIAGTQRE